MPRSLQSLSIVLASCLWVSLVAGCGSKPADDVPSKPAAPVTEAAPNAEATKNADATSPAAPTAAVAPSGDAATTDTAVTLAVVTPEQYKQLIAKHRGQVVVVDFWATWCGPCVKQFPHTVALQRKYADRGLVAVSMSFDSLDDQGQVLDFLKRQNAMIPNLISSLDGPGPEQMETYEIPDGAVPHYKIYDRQGKLRKTYSGNPEEQGLEQLLEQLLSEPKP